MHPTQQQGRRLPSNNSVTVRLMWSWRVSGFLQVILQQIHSLRARGVKSSQRSRADSSATRALRKSDGTVCTTPVAICLAMTLNAHQFAAAFTNVFVVPLDGLGFFEPTLKTVIVDLVSISVAGFGSFKATFGT